MKTLDWYGLYGESWNEIVSEAFSHPAKFSRALIRRIYEHALERGWLAEGDTVLDPFAGVGLGAADALAFGLNWTGNELEAHFVDMGRGCECTGISKGDWRRCFGRWKRFAHKDGRHWCPRCLAEAERVVEPRPPALPGMGPPPTASYERDSGKIPCTEPHHYVGNLELFARHARNGARATLLQGDSQRLIDILQKGTLNGNLSSHQTMPSLQKGVSSTHVIKQGTKILQPRMSKESSQDINLGDMPIGDPPQVKGVVGSPPYFGIRATATCDTSEPARPKEHWVGDQRRGREGTKWQFTKQIIRDYGTNPANLGNMREGDYAAVVSSPAYASGCAHTGGDDPKPEHVEGGELRFVEYGRSAGQLAALPEGDVDAVISSPPTGQAQSGGVGFWEGLEKKHGRRFSERVREGSQGYRKDQLGDSPGQLAAMPEGEFKANAVVSSPPFESTVGKGNETKGFHSYDENEAYNRCKRDYFVTSNPDNLGNAQGDTFWSAARQVVRQCWLALAPGGVAIFVLKDFIRDKKRVPFCDQWRRMCEACGFETVKWIRAWLVEDRGAQWALDGELVERRVERKSFFRRLAERKGSPRIDYEVVLVMRKAEAV